MTKRGGKIDRRGAPSGGTQAKLDSFVQAGSAQAGQPAASSKAQIRTSSPAPNSSNEPPAKRRKVEEPPFEAPKQGFNEVLRDSLLGPVPNAVPRKEKRPRVFVISLYSGCGIGDTGFFRGLAQARYNGRQVEVIHLICIEGDLETANAAQKLMGDHTVVAAFDLDPANWYRHGNIDFVVHLLERHGYDPDLGDTIHVVATPPCQAASYSGKREAGSELDKHSYSPFVCIKELSQRQIKDKTIQPTSLTYENVQGIKNKFDVHKKDHILTHLERLFVRLGWAVAQRH